jgi:riboflavin biosynthesis pyrimidine reductase
LRSLFPEASERVNLVETYSRGLKAAGDGPLVRVNMISTLDGATSFAGRSGGLGGPGDKLLFSVLRSLADVVLVGAGTARAEHYGPAKLPAEVQQMREGRGQRRLPPIAVVTQSLNLDWDAPLFLAGDPRPIVIAPGNSSAVALARAAQAADVLTTGAGAVDLGSALLALAERGMHQVLCEGGPRLNTSLAAAELVDELCLTLSPKLAGSFGGGLLGGWLGSGGHWHARRETEGETWLSGQPFTRLLDLSLVHVLEEDGFLFLRLRPSYRGGSGVP